jgi:phosphohistidine phosphatase
MKKLVIMRHGKSSWDHPDLKDHLRPLNQRGVNNAISVAAKLLEVGLSPDAIVSSPAIRALDTAIIVATGLSYPLHEIATEGDIYEASEGELLKVLGRLDDGLNIVMLFGHNPGLTSLVNRLQSENLFNLPTSGVFAIELPINSWHQIGQAKGQKWFSIIARELD